MSSTHSEIGVSIEVSGIDDLDDTQQQVVDTYEDSVETFLRKNANYGNSFEDSAKVESILKHGEVREDELPETISRQIFVRGMLDKVSRFYQLTFEGEDDRVGENVVDTLLDLGNYSIMLAAKLRSYGVDDD